MCPCVPIYFDKLVGGNCNFLVMSIISLYLMGGAGKVVVPMCLNEIQNCPVSTSALRIESNAACKMESPKARHSLKAMVSHKMY